MAEEMSAKAISLLGMEFQRTRLEAASLNIANVDVVSSQQDAAFKPVVANLNIEQLNFDNFLNSSSVSLVARDTDNLARAIFKPEHPMANAEGYVFTPNINVAEEMIALNSAIRGYEANIKAFNAYREMSAKALEIGK